MLVLTKGIRSTTYYLMIDLTFDLCVCGAGATLFGIANDSCLDKAVM